MQGADGAGEVLAKLRLDVVVQLLRLDELRGVKHGQPLKLGCVGPGHQPGEFGPGGTGSVVVALCQAGNQHQQETGRDAKPLAFSRGTPGHPLGDPQQGGDPHRDQIAGRCDRHDSTVTQAPRDEQRQKDPVEEKPGCGLMMKCWSEQELHPRLAGVCECPPRRLRTAIRHQDPGRFPRRLCRSQISRD